MKKDYNDPNSPYYGRVYLEYLPDDYESVNIMYYQSEESEVIGDDYTLSREFEKLITKYDGKTDLFLKKRLTVIAKEKEMYEIAFPLLRTSTAVRFEMHPSKVKQHHIIAYSMFIDDEEEEIKSLQWVRENNKALTSIKRKDYFKRRDAERKDRTQKPTIREINGDEFKFMNGAEAIKIIQERALEEHNRKMNNELPPAEKMSPGQIAYWRNHYATQFLSRTWKANDNPFKILTSGHILFEQEVFVDARMDGYDYRWDVKTLRFNKIRSSDGEIVKYWQLEAPDFEELKFNLHPTCDEKTMIPLAYSSIGREIIVID